MLGAPRGYEEVKHDSKTTTKKKKSTVLKTNDKEQTIESWFYGEVIFWRRIACFFWLGASFDLGYLFLSLPFGILDFYSLSLLYCCMALVMFSQQTLVSGLL